MSYLYYIQTNLFCLFFIGLIQVSLPAVPVLKTDQKIFRRFIPLSVIFCLADSFGWVAELAEAPWSGAVILAMDTVYYLTSVIICFQTLLYVVAKIDGNPVRIRKYAKYWVIPLILFAILLMVNLKTSIIFSVTNGHYQRENGIVLHWIVSWGYLAAAAVTAWRAAARAKERAVRRELLPIGLFLLLPVCASLLQVLLYGSSLIQLGFTMAMMIVFIRQQNAQISIDALTGINNRGQLNRYLEEQMASGTPEEHVVLIMMDVNGFKKINDTYGHLTGDQALNSVAGCLKNVCSRFKERLFLARYGGDEFVLAGFTKDYVAPADITRAVDEELAVFNEKHLIPAALTVSQGYAVGCLKDFDSMDHLILQADEAMYCCKKKQTARREEKTALFSNVNSV